MFKSNSNSNILQKIYDHMESSKVLQTVRGGLVMLIPIVLIGCFSQLLQSLPIIAYQKFIKTFCNGLLLDIFVFTNNATIGVLALYVTICISLCYSKQYLSAKFFNYGPVISSLISFFIFSGFVQNSFNKEYLGNSGMFTAIVCSLGASSLYCTFYNWMNKHFTTNLHIYTNGVDDEFTRAMKMIFPSCMVVITSAVLYYCFMKFFGVTSFQILFSNLMGKLFENSGRSLGTMILYSVLASILWFFGLHGNNILIPVSQNLFEPAIRINTKLILRGEMPTEIYSPTFYNVFGLMGGTGNLLSLLIAILLFSKKRSNRKLAKYSIPPMLFNIGETLTLGLPIVFNPIMFIPYVLTPVVLILFSSLVMHLGLVPIPTTNVDWTTPALLGGFKATGSVAGSILQIINIFIGVWIYCPFVKLYDKAKERNAHKRMNNLVSILQQSEAENKPIELLSKKDEIGETAKSIAEDLQYYLEHDLPVLHYQPQYDYKGCCVGAEALLRWEHPLFGTIFPPLVVKLAEESDLLITLEKSVFQSVVHDMDSLLENMDENAHISVNVTGTTIQTEEFELFLKDLQQTYPRQTAHICIEITEQAAINLNQNLVERLTRIRELGYRFAIDDFSMGSTSIKYLQTNVFDLIKLDGSLIKNMTENPRSREIIASITHLSKSFDIQVLAEFVETDEQKKSLKENGCMLYQGHLYSPAIPVEKFGDAIKKNSLK